MKTCTFYEFDPRTTDTTRYRSYFGTMTVAQALSHLSDWPPFDGPVELDEAIRRAWANCEAKDHTALCALMQSGQWRCL